MNKFIKACLITVLTMVSFCIVSNAKEFNFISDPTEKVVYPGDTVEIKLSIKNIQDIEEGINTIVGYMEYEEKLFSSMNFEGKDKWEVTYNNLTKSDLYGKFAITTMQNGITKDEQVATLKLKLKDNLPERETEIKFSKLVSSDGNVSIEEEDRIVKLIIQKKPEEPVKNTTVDDKKQPKPGTNAITGDKILMYVGVILIVIIVWIVVFIIIKKNDKKDEE